MNTETALCPQELPASGPAGALALPAAGGVPELWVVRVPGNGSGLAASAPFVLDGSELRRAAAFRKDADRDIYGAVHVGLRLLLGSYLGVDPAEVPFVREDCPSCGGPHGRPAVQGAPLHFSITHSGDLGLLAFAGTPVGVDAEVVPAGVVANEVGPLLHPREAGELARLDAESRPGAFVRAWARKEAYLKGLGTGLARSMSADYVGTGRVPAAGPGDWLISDVVVGDGHAAAVAVLSGA
ncbi:4'-phosphopantetheinyl transferase superfamily protein [Streptomyces sp. A3M-1-3]|uniref:4'-phosphopantetheinyl transferase family protein n=1 Tax=Streptomyces sp. A3M-1-3 TaxID=2962044 RepID=UPI0020B7CC16|nr:4'-phosphopantetheinyl transferase superfamily protein [Streptomyces sp. A3M-1-3]MCP3820828.1 4'-phosphopantetheinyl transferase superfamily protein [Streptomyces sp. A3M-1-3]